MKKTVIAFLLAAVMLLSLGAGAFAATSYPMQYLSGTQDEVTGMPVDDEGIPAEAYAVSAQIPKREGYEFLYWTLDYRVVTYTVVYVVTPDPVYGIPDDAIVPTDSKQYESGNTVTVADQLTSTQTTAINSVTGAERTGTWTFIPWDKGDENGEFEITEDTTITGEWKFTPATFFVNYVVTPDPVYGTPDDAVVPTDPREYNPGDPVTVAEQLTSTQETGINSTTGEERQGTWTFIPWDKGDENGEFEITEDTTITGGWRFISKYKYTVHHLDYENLDRLADDEVIWIDELGQVAPTSKLTSKTKCELYPQYKNSKYNPVKPTLYEKTKADWLLPGAVYAQNKTRYEMTVTLTEDNLHIFFFYYRSSAG